MFSPFNRNLNSKVDTNIYLALLFLFAVVICYLEHMAIIPVIIIFGAVYYYAQKNMANKDVHFTGYMDNVIRNIERTNYYAVSKLDVGMAVFDMEGKLQWRNDRFVEIVGNKELRLKPEQLLPLQQNAFEILSVKDGEKVIQLESSGKYYKMRYCSVKTQEKAEVKQGDNKSISGLMLYLTDVTDEEILRQQYENNKLSLAYVCFDNYEEVTRGLSDTSIATLTGEVNGMLTKWVAEQHGFICRMNKEKCLIGFNQSSVKELQDTRFDILDKIRELRIGNKIRPTVSIGLACDGETLEELRLNSDRALNMALGRGGDQAVVIKDQVIQYFGGTSEVTTKSTRVRARMVAQTIKENMLKADRIFIMGHRDEDFDALGSAIGTAKLARSLGKLTTIVVSDDNNNSIKKIKELFNDDDIIIEKDAEYLQLLINESEAIKLVTENSLLILVDHHRAMITASPQLLKAIPNKLIIDHHRRAEDIISDTVLQYLEPSASSASELVTELVGYFNERLELSPAEATALYAGIVLDTKNFALQTGERTFEAAALLRRSGGNPNLVRLLFKDDMEMVQQRAKLIADAKMPYPGLAISVYRKVEKNSKAQIIAAQTADGLVTIGGIQVGVAIVEYNDGSLGISARSDGSINVQRIMEELGGGGHQTVAGVQLQGKRAKDIEPQIIALAKEQIEESNENESNSVARR